MLRSIFFLLTVNYFFLNSTWAQEINVGFQLMPGQRTPYEKVFSAFTKETGIKIISMPRQDANYKHDLPIWLLQGQETPDVVYWQASQRLYFYTAKGAVHPITALWNEQNWDKNFSHVKNGVTYKEEIYALPLHYYNWGIYYKKSLVDRFGGPPTTWEEFISICTRLKNAGITPIGIGAKEQWPVAAWFDYIDLRLNGLEFHLKLLAGDIPFTDMRVQHVLTEWKRLIDLHFMNTDNTRLDWDAIFPYMYRDKIAFSLIGNFVKSKLASSMAESIGFIPFPKMANVPNFEEAPMDVLLIPSKAKHIADAEKFILFMARAEVQSELAADLGYFPASKMGVTNPENSSKVGAELLRNSAGVSQYFDRDTIPLFEKKAVPILTNFINSGDIKETTNQLERARKESFH